MIYFTSLHFEGDSLEWWQHGVISQGYSLIYSFDEFSKWLVKRFNRKKENNYFQDLTSLRQLRIADDNVIEFQRISIMIHHIPKERLTFLFIEAMMEPFLGMVKVSSLKSLDDAIWETYDLEPTVKSLKGG